MDDKLEALDGIYQTPEDAAAFETVHDMLSAWAVQGGELNMLLYAMAETVNNIRDKAGIN